MLCYNNVTVNDCTYSVIVLCASHNKEH